ncbi:hypothetical protein [Stenotrophomonas sp. PD6]|uniref:hypothetical protein n=1 Tax=Stenotrophomonas sp. PD6 TaxID=3368612 RepID=UPI003BA21C51
MTMTLKAYRSIVLGAACVIAIAALAGCSRGAETAQPNVEVNKENAEMRTVVPLTRPIALDKAGEVINLEFEVPPPGPNAVPYLMLGLRLARPDAASGTALSMRLVEAKMAANVQLLRVEEGAVTMVPLMRNTPDLRDRVTVPVDGSVPGLTTTSVDTSLLEDAGLLDATLFYDVLQFASAENIQPGHYRLSIELSADHPEFQRDKAELLVAYFKKAK